MSNPFFSYNGPFSINEIFKALKLNVNKNTVMTTDQSVEYINKIKEQNRLRQQRFIEKKKTTGEYEAYNETRTEYKKKYRNKTR